MADVPDPVFAEEMVGPGVAIPMKETAAKASSVVRCMGPSS